ncbi:Do family serine endopeptidase [Candidatus Laterigemmans baculatus]|uniref:Do family serine endopeptidase n=1 Tax=Candidatus Laterigemmans baculatus TaxID=2770505 RepID=UPI0013DD3CE4|nr:Do family serine endopeptidase [Candidatus Laterigemmans baculatus]
MRRQWNFLSVALAAMLTGSLLTGVVLSLPEGLRSSDAYAVQVAAAEEARGNLQTAQDLSSAFRNVSNALRPSVVSVQMTRRARAIRGGGGTNGLEGIPPQMRRFFEDNGIDPFGGRQGGGMQRPEQSGIGSGVIIRDDGYILTNNHVVEGADELVVQLSDGREFEAETVGTDPETDLAVLKIEAENLEAAVLGDSDAIQVGDWVLAMGSPFELEQTVTAGIISAKNRVQGIVGGGGGFEDFLQTDAAINPGNSGGPLVNLQGEVVGINTAILSRSGGYNGIGFAIPSGLARPVMESIIESGSVRRGFLGAQLSEIPNEVAEKLDLSARSGAYIRDVLPGQPAAQGGLQAGDIVQSINGRSIRNWSQFRNLIASQGPGARVQMEVLRDGKTVDLEITLGERTEAALAQFAPGEPGIFLNARVQPLNPELAKRMGFEGIDAGLLVTQVARGPERSPLRAGDVIIAAQGQPVSTVAELLAAKTKADQEEVALRLTVLRGDEQELVIIE